MQRLSANEPAPPRQPLATVDAEVAAQQSQVTRRSLPPGLLINGRYRVVRELGYGGMGTVLLAEDTRLARSVAVKVLRASAGPQDLESFCREARLLAAVSHAHVVTLLDAGDHEGRPYFAMEYVDGKTLDQLIAEQNGEGLPLDVALGLARQICGGLGATHERGIVHRDIKPGNVMVVGDRRAAILDFGLARDDERRERHEVSGTPHYLAPEDIRGRSLTGSHARRSDIYSLGVTIFEMLAGRPPFIGESAAAVMDLHLKAAPPSLLEFRPDLPPAFDHVLRRALAKNPLARQISCAALASDLWAARNGEFDGCVVGGVEDEEITIRIRRLAD